MNVLLSNAGRLRGREGRLALLFLLAFLSFALPVRFLYLLCFFLFYFLRFLLPFQFYVHETLLVADFHIFGLFTTLLGTHVRGVLSQLKFQPPSFAFLTGIWGTMPPLPRE